MTWLQSGIERLLEAPQNPNNEEYWSAYDDCLWRITTSGKDELEEFIANHGQEPYCHLPIPLFVVMCRLYALESKERTATIEQAITLIHCYCSPDEEEGALGGIGHAPTVTKSSDT